jgi:hypothetical protein
MNRHPYRTGYSTLPALTRIEPVEVFRPDPLHGDWFAETKRRVMAVQTCQVESDCSPEVYAAACAFIAGQYPLPLHGPLGPTGDWTARWVFGSLAAQMQEDVVIHRVQNGRDWMAAGHVCFPSGWNPSAKVGRSLNTIHAPVPGLNRSNSKNLAKAMVSSGPYERYVWGVIFAPELNGHSARPKAVFDPKRPSVWVKVERQVTVPLPDVGAALFVLSHALVGEPELDAPALARTLQQMSREQRVYKGVDHHFDAIIGHLRRLNEPSMERPTETGGSDHAGRNQ